MLIPASEQSLVRPFGPSSRRRRGEGKRLRGSALHLQRVLQLAQPIDLLLRGLLLLLGCVGEILLGVLDLAGDAIGGEFVDWNRRLGEDDQRISARRLSNRRPTTTVLST